MRQFFLEPTDENLKRFRRVDGDTAYWRTIDFFLFDPDLEDGFFSILEYEMDATEANNTHDKEAERKHKFSLGRMIIRAARAAGISPNDYRIQYSHYATVIWTPICIWRKDESGAIHYSLMNNLPRKRT